jgi:uncharacterized protein
MTRLNDWHNPTSLDMAVDVPSNVQRLAHACWDTARAGRTVPSATPVSVQLVQMVTDQLVRRDDPFYTQIWNRMTSPQQKAVLALVEGQADGQEVCRRLR